MKMKITVMLVGIILIFTGLSTIGSANICINEIIGTKAGQVSVSVHNDRPEAVDNMTVHFFIRYGLQKKVISEELNGLSLIPYEVKPYPCPNIPYLFGIGKIRVDAVVGHSLNNSSLFTIDDVASAEGIILFYNIIFFKYS